MMREQLGCNSETRIGKMSTEYKAENKRCRKSAVGYGRRWTIGIIILCTKENVWGLYAFMKMGIHGT